MNVAPFPRDVLAVPQRVFALIGRAALASAG
jgi:hypothetical protein